MRVFLLAIARLLVFRFRSRGSLELEVIALRHQLDVLKRKERWRRRNANVRLTRGERRFWGFIYHIYPQCVEFMHLAKPRTIMAWHRNLFRIHWRNKRVYRGGNGNVISEETKQLIKMMKQENPLWGVNRISGELRMLGYTISSTSVHKYLPRKRTPPTPGWRAFLHNHIHETVGMDMFVAVSATFRLLYGFLLIEHRRRKVIHLAVTEHPTADWVTRQVRQAFRSKRPKYILRDRDALYRPQFQNCLKAMGIKERVIDRQSPWQNAYAEAFIHTLRQECLNHIVPLSTRHLQRVLDAYIHYYNKTRCHSSLDYDSPEHRPKDPPENGKIISIPEVGGLHHRYERRAA